MKTLKTLTFLGTFKNNERNKNWWQLEMQTKFNKQSNWKKKVIVNQSVKFVKLQN